MFKSTIPSIQRIHDELKQIQSDEIIEEKNEFIFKNSIKFNNVYFNYGDRKKNVLKNVNFEIFKGDNVGIIGQTGSGKSTLINLISGLINPSSGKLLIDEKIPANSIMWKKKVAYVSQNIFLLDNTIETNIAFGDQNIDYEKMNRVCRYAQLETTIKKLKKGLRTRVGEHGKELSGGEIQRIAIARALYLGREVFIFDEATSALDKKTEESFIDIIKGELKNFTLIIISHKLGSLKFCNKIFKIDDGRIEKFKN